MKKLEAIRVALHDLAEELEAEQVKFNSATNRIIAIANHLMQNGVSNMPEGIDRYHIKPRIRVEVLKDSFLMEGELVVSELLGKKELIVKAMPRLNFLLSGPNDKVVLERLKALFGEFQEMTRGNGHYPHGFRSLEEIKFLLFIFTTTSH
ncbi:hypothetical protein [Rufibacter sp. XAAS-G3-1]|uniref:hypothetical protein n=1 Tax=Rufibacter sp. XAAS-G3-1 TaxID=2729134 RepID=UPI0015E7145A|nr:hypothetical protein [Rufibacter sp. XAAS-G3-1]